MEARGTGSKRARRAPVRTARRGAAVVEMAIVTPLLMTMMLGMIEFGYIFMMQQSLTNGAREAARLATLPGTTDDEIRTRLQEALASTGLEISSDMVVIDHATLENPVVRVRVQVPYEDVTLLGVLPSSLFKSWHTHGTADSGESGGTIAEKRIGSSCSMRKEGSL